MANVNFTDNSKKVLLAMAKAKERGLEAVGMTAEGHAKEVITNAGAVDTGRLRNSITWATKGRENTSYTYKDKAGKSYTEKIGGGVKEDEVYIGTNVEYAAGIELGTHRKAGAVHFLQQAATNHTEEYKKIIELSLENA